MSHSNALSTLTPDQETALIWARGRMVAFLEECDPETRWRTALGTWNDIDRLQRAFPATFGPRPGVGLEDPLPSYLEGC